MEQMATIIKQQRIAKGLSMRALAIASGISPSYLWRIERGERFPSALVLRKFAKPLGFYEVELFTLAGFLSPTSDQAAESKSLESVMGLDPYVARVLSQEPIQVQRAVIGILAILKSLTKGETE